jgi:hypothetical protein
MSSTAPKRPRSFKVCARPFFDLLSCCYGRRDRRANHGADCRGPVFRPDSAEGKSLRAEHVKLGQQEGARA